MSVPGAAGIVNCAWKILRGASLASTETVMVGGTDFGAGLFFCATTGIATAQTAIVHNPRRLELKSYSSLIKQNS